MADLSGYCPESSAERRDREEREERERLYGTDRALSRPKPPPPEKTRKINGS